MFIRITNKAKELHAYHVITEKLRHPGRALDLKTKYSIGFVQ